MSRVQASQRIVIASRRSPAAKPHWRAWLALVLALALPAAALAQMSTPRLSNQPTSDPLSDRYQRARKGSNMGEWATRLRDEDPSVRLEAVESMGESGDPEAVSYLTEAVTDPDLRVRAKAVDYLGELKATEATFFLTQRLFLADTEEGLRHRVLMALGKIGDPKASRPILEYISREVPSDVRGTGIYALGEIGDPEITPELESMLAAESDDRLRRLIREALTKISSRDYRPERRRGGFPSPLEAALNPEPPPQR